MFSQAFSAMPCSPLASHPASPHTQLAELSYHCPFPASLSHPGSIFFNLVGLKRFSCPGNSPQRFIPA